LILASSPSGSPQWSLAFPPRQASTAYCRPEISIVIVEVQNFPNTRAILVRHARHRIRRKARQLIGMAGLRPADREDLEQELTLRLWRGLRDFNPALGNSSAFVATVLERAANSILRLRNSEKRYCRHVRQLMTTPVFDDEDSESTEGAAEIAVAGDSHEAAVDLAHDVAVVLNRLPPSLRTLAEDLKHRGISEIVIHSELARSTIYTRVAKLRAAFQSLDRKSDESSRTL
jgi:RNA polymerase sigma-70 factor, ECF subfamily